MKCYNHPEKDAIAQCVTCGKGLCEECAKKWTPPICDDCQRNSINAELESVNSELVRNAVLAIGGVIIGVLMGSSFPLGGGNAFLGILTLSILYAFCLPSYAAGWKWMNHLTDKFAFFGTPAFWLIYLLIKLLFSGAVGVFALPYRLYHINKRKKELNSLLSYMQQ